MREIKFRAWEKNLKEMIPIDSISFKTNIANVGSAWRFFHEIELMQFTGLKDKNGKEIYEGDVVYFIMPDENYVEKGNGWEDIGIHKGFEVTGEVKCIDGGWFIDEGGKSGISGVPLYFDGEQIVEVKGNVYENPELLEEPKPSLKREELIEKAREYKRVPGHGMTFEEMTDEELEKFIGIMESMFKLAFGKGKAE